MTKIPWWLAEIECRCERFRNYARVCSMMWGFWVSGRDVWIFKRLNSRISNSNHCRSGGNPIPVDHKSVKKQLMTSINLIRKKPKKAKKQRLVGETEHALLARGERVEGRGPSYVLTTVLSYVLTIRRTFLQQLCTDEPLVSVRTGTRASVVLQRTSNCLLPTRTTYPVRTVVWSYYLYSRPDRPSSPCSY